MRQFAIKFSKQEMDIMKDFEIEPSQQMRKAGKHIGLSLHKRLEVIIKEKQMNNDFLNYEMEVIFTEK